MDFEIKATRKNIWQVDCLSLTTILASSFDTGEVFNLISDLGRLFRDRLPVCNESGTNVYRFIHRLCHSQNSFSLRLENLLNNRYRTLIEKIESLCVPEICEMVRVQDPEETRNFSGLLWALATDPRNEIEKIRLYVLDHYLSHAVSRFTFNMNYAPAIVQG